jgi:hypothetical protein
MLVLLLPDPQLLTCTFDESDSQSQFTILERAHGSHCDSTKPLGFFDGHIRGGMLPHVLGRPEARSSQGLAATLNPDQTKLSLPHCP